MLHIKELVKVFSKGTSEEKTLFDNLDLHVNKKDFITVIGSNGAGKSTLLNIITGTLSLDEGTISLENEEITRVLEHERSKYMGRVYQDPSKGTSPSMTILENLSLAYNKGKSFGLGYGVNKKNLNHFKERLATLNLGLENKLNDKVSLLSGGQRQALALLMATMVTPKLLLLDEHTAALDPKTSENIIGLTDSIVKEKNITTLMVTHNINHAIKYGNRIIMMHKSRIIMDAQGEEKQALTPEKIIGYFNSISQDEGLSDRIILN